VVVPIVLVVVLVLVIEKAEYVLKMRWGVEDEDEYKDEYESPASCGLWGASCKLRVTGCVVVPIVLVVVLVLVIEKTEYVLKMRWGVEDEDEYKDEYESLARCGL
jgi:uncharacterized membrane protein YdfJ with MMPL/SSD domain